MDGTRKCPYCAEEIAADAARCRYCRGRVAALDPARWHRSHPERRLAGVAAAVSHALAWPLPAVRLGFIVLTFFHLLGPVLYGALWLLIPPTPGERAPFEQLVARVVGWIDHWLGRGPTASGPRPPTNGATHFDATMPGGPLA